MYKRTKSPMDSDVFFNFSPKNVGPPPRAKYGSMRVHYVMESSDNEPYALCRGKNAVWYTQKWAKVTCGLCRKEEQQTIERLYQELVNKRQQRKQVREDAIFHHITRGENEPFAIFQKRVAKVATEYWKRQDEIYKRESYAKLSYMDFTTLPLDKNPDFPIEVYEAHGWSMEDGETIKLTKEKYREILQDMKRQIEKQLKMLKKK